MKKNLLALTVAALAAATVASTASATTVYDKDGTSLAVYGRVQSVFYSDKANTTSAQDQNKEYSATVNTSGRFGVKVRQQFNQQFAGFAMAEWDVADGYDGSNSFRARELSVGVDMAQFGKVKFGRFEEAIKYALFATDIYDDWGGYGYQGNDDRRDGMVQYQWSGYGFDALVSYGFSKSGAQVDGAFNHNNSNSFTERHNLDSSVSLAAGYTSPDVVFGPIQVRAGVAFGSFTEGQKFSNDPNNKTLAGNLDSYTSFALGASWGKLNIGPYVGVQFSQRTFDLYEVTAGNPDDFKVMGIEAAVGYSFANGVTFRTGIDYIQNEIIVDSKVKDIEGAVLPAYLNWQISPNFNVWGEARFDLGSASDKNGNASYAALTGKNLDENVYSFGIRYTF